MYFSRFLRIGDLAPNSQIIPLSDKPFRQYQNRYGFNYLGNVANLRQEDAELIANVYAITADFFYDEIWEDIPEGMPQNAVDAFQWATFYRSLYGIGVVIRQGESYHAIDPRFYWPVLERGVKIGDAIVQPYSTRPLYPPDRAWASIVLANSNRAIVRDYNYTGVTLGQVLSRSVVGPVQVATFGPGDGFSDFQKVEPLVCELDRRLRNTGDVLHRFSKPHIQVPASSLKRDAQGNPVFNLQEDGSVLPASAGEEYRYLVLQADSRLSELHLRTTLSLISATTKVPAHYFGLTGLPRIESGQGLEAMDSATAKKVSVWREDIRRAAQGLGLTIQWPVPENNGPGGLPEA